MKIARIQEIALELEHHGSYFAPDMTPLPDQEGAIFQEVCCAGCKHTLGEHKEGCIIQELLELTGALDKLKDFGKPIRRYCFICNQVTKFVYCDNCGSYFCKDHADWDTGDVEESYRNAYPIHAKCS